MILMLASTLKMSTTVSDCGTRHLVQYDIKNSKILNKLNGKYYKMDYSDDDYKIIDATKDTNLIGKKILARSVATCALGDCCCAKCMGSTAALNIDIPDGIGAFNSDEVTKVIEQSILATKHLLTTLSEKIEFNENFDKFFNMIGGEINPIINDNAYFDNIDDFAIEILPDEILKVEELDDDSLYNSYISTGRFFVFNTKDPEERYEIAVKDKEIYISDDIISIMHKNKGIIPFSMLDDDTKLFEVIIFNSELTKPLYQLMDLLNKNKDDEVNENIDSMSQKFLELLIESKINANIVAGEIIINRLIVSLKNKYERPDFTEKTLEPYKIYTARKALETNKSPIVGIAFQNIKMQFTSEELFDERDAESYLDPFFKTNVSFKNYKKYANIINEEHRAMLEKKKKRLKTK